MDKIIMLGVSKINENDINEKYGDENLAVVMKNDEGKKTFIIPKLKSQDENVEIALTKRDLREISKLIKDGTDDDGIEIKLLVVKTASTNE